MKYLCSILAAALLGVLLLGCTSAQDTMTIDIPKIGKADCGIFIQGDVVMVIDCGESENSPEVLSALKQRRVAKIDCLIITHFDKDHVGGAAAVLEAYPVGLVLEPDYEPENPQSEAYTAYRQALTETGVPVRAVGETERFSLGTAQVTVTGTGGRVYGKNVDNNSSLLVSVTHAGNRFLFAGDIEKQRIQDLLQEGIAEYDFLKVPHHGGWNKALPDFLQAVGMGDAVITCSNKNPPAEETLDALEALGARTYLTSDGSITVSSSAKGIQVRQ